MNRARALWINSVWRPISVILALRRLRHEDQEFRVILGYVVTFKSSLGYTSLCLQKTIEEEEEEEVTSYEPRKNGQTSLSGQSSPAQACTRATQTETGWRKLQEQTGIGQGFSLFLIW